MATSKPVCCHCLCQRNHPRQAGICRGGEDLQIIYRAPDYMGAERTPVPFCSPCAAATLAASAARS